MQFCYRIYDLSQCRMLQQQSTRIVFRHDVKWVIFSAQCQAAAATYGIKAHLVSPAAAAVGAFRQQQQQLSRSREDCWLHLGFRLFTGVAAAAAAAHVQHQTDTCKFRLDFHKIPPPMKCCQKYSPCA